MRRVVHVEDVMGSTASFDVRLDTGIAPSVAETAIRRSCAALHEFDGMFSTYRPESAVMRLSRGELTHEDAPAQVREVLTLCDEMRTRTNGWFDPPNIGASVDPTGLVKGWAIDRALVHLRVPGIAAAMLNLGGDVAVFGTAEIDRGWQVGVRNPGNPGEMACVVDVVAAIATSGSYERGVHLIDPYTSEPVIRPWSATVVGPDLARADAIATAVAVGGADALAAGMDIPGFGLCIIDVDGCMQSTDGFPMH